MTDFWCHLWARQDLSARVNSDNPSLNPCVMDAGARAACPKVADKGIYTTGLHFEE